MYCNYFLLAFVQSSRLSTFKFYKLILTFYVVTSIFFLDYSLSFRSSMVSISTFIMFLFSIVPNIGVCILHVCVGVHMCTQPCGVQKSIMGLSWFLSTLVFIDLLHLCVCALSVCALCVCRCPQRPEELDPEDLELQVVVSCLMWVLALKLRSSEEHHPSPATAFSNRRQYFLC